MNRLSKQSKTMLMAGATLAVMAAAIPAAIWLTHTRSAKTGHARLLCEQHTQVNHTVRLGHQTIMPAMVAAKHCDTLTVINLNNQSVSVAIFSNGHQLTYDGSASRMLAPQQSVTITLLDSGHYQIGEARTPVRGELNISP